MSDAFDPTPEDRFTFGLWTVGNIGRDPFGDPVRAPLAPWDSVRRLAECGAWGVNFHDNDLVPFGSSVSARDAIVRRFKAALEETGIVVPMATTNLFTHPVFKDGAFTANDPQVRAFALRKTIDAIDLGVECGARLYVAWGGREGSETDVARDPRDAIERMREAFNFLCAYVRDQGYDLRFALEPKPNEPRSNIYFATVGHMLHFITTLDHPEMVGVNPEVAHETISGLSFPHAVAQAMDAGKLFHIDLNGQRMSRFDQDLRFGSEGVKDAFLLVRLLEGTAGRPGYDGPRHFDAHAYRTEDADGVWAFARGCMRTYKILAERARAFDADPEVRELVAATLHGPDEVDALTRGAYSAERVAKLRALEPDLDAIGAAGLGYERLDQLFMEHLLGVRSS